jgi:uncharacterized protein (TIGR03083 family)
VARAELTAFLDLLGQLEGDDWDKPTACTLWSVRDLVAHQAGHAQMGSGVLGFAAQANPRVTGPYRTKGMSTLDALNQAQVDRRRDLPIEQVIAELRDSTPRSIASRGRMWWPTRRAPVPVPPVGWMSLGGLLDRIFPRDMWIHRLDIADATGKPFAQTAGHDGVMVAQVVADAARYVRKKAPTLGLTLRLAGTAGGEFRLTQGAETVELAMDVTDFMRRTSDRLPVDGALQRTDSSASEAVTRRALAVLLAPY